MNTESEPAVRAALVRLNAFTERQPRWRVIAIAIVLVGLAAALDRAGPPGALPLLYALPILFVAWVAGWRWRIPIAVTAGCAALNFGLDLLSANASSDAIQSGLGQLAVFVILLIAGAMVSAARMAAAVVFRRDELRAGLGPVPIGSRFVILPEEAAGEVEDGKIPLFVEAGAAFGSGSHPTTRMCVALLEEIVRPGDRVFDLGCGSGILAIAALKLGAGSALGADIDPEAGRKTRVNADRNGVADRLSFSPGSLEAAADGQFDVVAANILADVLIALIGQGLTRTVGPGGSLILSGIKLDREDAVARALEGAGFGVVTRRSTDVWVALVARSAPGRA